MKLFGNGPEKHKWSKVEGATEYYINRLVNLEKISKTISNGYFYFDAQCLRDKSEKTLRIFTDWLELGSPLNSCYSQKLMTGIVNAGDLSENLKKGIILPGKTRYDDMKLDQALLSCANDLYVSLRNKLIGNSRDYIE